MQSILDKKVKNSKRWRKIKQKWKKLKRKLTNKNKDFQHKLSSQIIDYCKENSIDNIVVGDIQTKKLASNCKSKTLNKSTQNRGTLSRFKDFLKYKSKLQGIELKLVNEAYTSQTNCLNGKRELSSALNLREHELEDGLTVDRDLNAAVNIAKKHGALWLVHEDKFDKLNLVNLSKKYMNCSSDLCMINNIETSKERLAWANIS